MGEQKTAPSPAFLRVRDLSSLRACLTYFARINAGEMLDFRNLGFIDPGAVVLLRHFVRNTKAGQIRIIPPTSRLPRLYLLDQAKAAREEGQALFKAKAPNSFPLRFVTSEEAMIGELAKWREMLQKTAAIEEEEARRYAQHLTEVLTNSFSHGKTSKPCIVAGQTFGGRKHTVLSAVDSGIGIPASLRQSGRYVDRADHEWIAHSLEKGVTAGTGPTNRGFGLYILQDMVKQCGGKLIVLSGKGALLCTESQIEAQPLGEAYGGFSGTFMVLVIPTGGAASAGGDDEEG